MKIGPYVRTKFRTGRITITRLSDGMMYDLPCYSCIGLKQRRFDQSRVNILGSFRGVQSSFVITDIMLSEAEGGCGSYVAINNADGKRYLIQGDIGALKVYQSYMGTVRWGPNSTDNYTYIQDQSIAQQVYKDKAVISAYEHLNEPKSDVGLMLAEIRETINLITNPFNGIVKLASRMVTSAKRKARKGRKHGSVPKAKIISAISEQWLEYRYGIMPLVFDVTSLMDLAHEGFRKIDMTTHKQLGMAKGAWEGTKIDSSDTSLGLWTVIPGWNFIIQNRWVGKTSINQRSHCTIWYRDRSWSDTISIMSQLGLSVENIPSLIWEMVPFSFVADWFVDVGSWIRAIQPNPNISILASSLSTVYETEWILTWLNGQNSSVSAIEKAVTPIRMKARQFTRSSNPTLPSQPVVNPEVLNLKRSLDSFALIWGNLPRLLRKR